MACLDKTFDGEFCEEVTVSVVFVGKTIPNQNCKRRQSFAMSEFLHFGVWWTFCESKTS